MRRRDRALCFAYTWRGPDSRLVSALGLLFVADGGRSGFSRLSMGRAPARDRLSCHFLCPAPYVASTSARSPTLNHRVVAVPLVTVPPDLHLRRGQADERRSDVARSDCLAIPL